MTVKNTSVGGKVKLPAIGEVGVNVETHNCPDGYYWVAPYHKGILGVGGYVRGHCRKAGDR